ncbi:hypothetical protein FB45DRAFT_987278 [Roridomyces roridus]|uniref:6-phosphogluconate dehydrogenase C-terminal domain-like protein n=1 Tax=Roridomyces roridus TaxID=1738132 RepID=A0AAD7FWV3_9AGAR|nr:hypothetical protein FB45DRAFT_987278 [Roridomyces roridus]
MASIAIISPGAMGAAVGRVLVRSGCKVFTNLEGRSDSTRKRAHEAGMQHASYKEIGATSDFVLSILPPSDAFTLAQKVIQETSGSTRVPGSPPLIFVDCNAVNPVTVHRIADLFADSPLQFLDASIIGGPPKDDYTPTFYASGNATLLDRFVALSKYGLKISALTGEGAGVGDASALKMSYAGITKGTTGLFTTMILSAYQSSPATAAALLEELHASQPTLLKRIVNVIPPMVPKAYRWVGEMSEIADFVGEGEGDIYRGLSQLYARIEQSGKGDGKDLEKLAEFVEEAKRKD